MRENNYGTLYICPTPIGNLKDITLRVIEVLKKVDIIAAEDTRVTIKLINHLDIKVHIESYHEHNKFEKGKHLVNKLKEGKDIALVSDAGTPVISDPGDELVKMCIEQKINIVSLPGPTALITALTISGISSEKFIFEGFLPQKKKERRERLDYIKHLTYTIVLYESPHRLHKTIKDLYDTFGNRRITICRELTKKFEEIVRTDIKGAVIKYNEEIPKGEFVLVIEGMSADEYQLEQVKRWESLDLNDHVNMYIEDGLSKKEAIKMAAKDRKIGRAHV